MKPTSGSALLNVRVLLALAVCFAGICLVVFAAPNPYPRNQPSVAPSGTVQEAWVARYNASTDDEATAIAVDGSGNVYVTGHNGTIKYDSLGQEQWVAPGPVGAAIALDTSGNVYVTGYTIGQNGLDYLTTKYNSNGQEQWSATYNSAPGNSPDQARAVAVDGSGNVYVTGVSSTNAGFNFDYATVKYNSAGQEQWVARYNGPGNDLDSAYAIAVDTAGNVYVTGESYGAGSTSDYATIKYDSAGQQQWVARYNGPANYVDGARAMVIDGSANVYVTGYSFGVGNVGDDYATIKYNSAGQQQWGCALQRAGKLG
jgi:hypothetical protein